MIPKYWKVVLDGYGECDAGEVFSNVDGELLGTWTLGDDVFTTFTPLGESEQMFFEPHVGMLCSRIVEWHDARELGGSEPDAHVSNLAAQRHA